MNMVKAILLTPFYSRTRTRRETRNIIRRVKKELAYARSEAEGSDSVLGGTRH